MESQKQITFSNLKPNISDAIKESCPTTDAVAYKIADKIAQIKTVTIEPGVEIAQGLSMIIDTVIRSSVCLGCDLSVIARGILIGAFRSRSIQLEAHKTIRLLVQEIIQAVFYYKGDIKRAVDGLLAGSVVIAREHKLNEQESLIITAENILNFSKAANSQFAQDIKAAMPAEYDGLKLK